MPPDLTADAAADADGRVPPTGPWIPDGGDTDEALARITHLAVGAHPDDIEIGALFAIGTCRDDPNLGLGAVVCTNGAGGPRHGRWADLADAAYIEARALEQRRAASLGRYAALWQLGRSSDGVRADAHDLVVELQRIVTATTPEVVVTHDPFDSHETHAAIARATIDALRASDGHRLTQVLGVEGWRSLRWLHRDDRVPLDVGRWTALGDALLAEFPSQRAPLELDRLAEKRRRANAATVRELGLTHVTFAVDLTAPSRPDGPPLDVLLAELEHRAPVRARRREDRGGDHRPRS